MKRSSWIRILWVVLVTLCLAVPLTSYGQSHTTRVKVTVRTNNPAHVNVRVNYTKRYACGDTYCYYHVPQYTCYGNTCYSPGCGYSWCRPISCARGFCHQWIQHWRPVRRAVGWALFGRCGRGYCY